MPFQRTDRKMRELKNHLFKMLSSKTVDEFEDNFSAFLAAGRSVTLALQKDNKGNQDFDLWYQEKQNEMRKDELCKYFKDARDMDLHTGDSNVQSHYQIRGPVVLSAKPGQNLVITSRGVYDVAQPNTPMEERQQRSLGKEEVAAIFLANAPLQHKGVIISDTSPASLCKLFQAYLEALIKEAKEKFI